MPMSCTWLSPWLMLSSLRSFRDRRGIGDVNRAGFLLWSFKATNHLEPLRMSLDCLIDLIAVKCQHDSRVRGGGSPRVGVILLVALIDGRAQRNAAECNQIRIHRCFHKNRSAGPRRQQ